MLSFSVRAAQARTRDVQRLSRVAFWRVFAGHLKSSKDEVHFFFK
ncbi:hypothetical protein PO252_09415 [Limosilactobacillus mucosae]|nr:hypothetical protein [Limosilactobacillus mucosae]MDC2840032.1 hypothetical protein [Limosilactobacillus mucosae]